MNYIQRIYDLLVEAQINEVKLYRSTVAEPGIHPYLQANPDTGKSEYGIRNTRGKLRNITHPEVMASAERGSQIRKEKGLPQLPSLRDRAKALFKRRRAAGKTERSMVGPGTDNQLFTTTSRGHTPR